MTNHPFLTTLLASALGLAGGYAAHSEAPAAFLSSLESRLEKAEISSPIKTLKDALARTKEKVPAPSIPSVQGDLADAVSARPNPEQYIPEKIDRVEFVYQNAQARETFHKGLQLFLNQYPYSDELGERIYRMRQLEKFFYSTQFGIKDPEWTGGYISGTPVMDEQRAQRILDYAITNFGGGRHDQTAAQESPIRTDNAETNVEDDTSSVDSLVRPLSPQIRTGPIRRFKSHSPQRDCGYSSPSGRTYGDWLGRKPIQRENPTNEYHPIGQGASFWSPRPIQ